MAKKRKTPSSPRSPHDSSPGLDGESFRDTDEQFVGEVHPDFALELPGPATQIDLPALERDEELLDSESPPEEISIDVRSGRGDGSTGERVERRLTATLLKIFTRRRQQIRLSLDQLSRLSGIALDVLQSFENPRPGQTITYDQMVVLARVLGVKAEELPGIRRREARLHLGTAVAELERILLGAPLLRFEGQHGERYGGDVERAAASKAFTIRIEDASLQPVVRRGTLLGFMNGVTPRDGGILLLRHRRSSLLAMRRYEPPAYVGLLEWQPAYVVGGEWHVVGTLEVVLPPR